MKLSGYLERNRNLFPLNFIILITKKYIYWCAKTDFKINIYFLQKEVELAFIEQKMLSKINSLETNFLNKWQLWLNLFTMA